MDYQQKDVETVSVSFCGYSGKIRYLVIGDDTISYLRPASVKISGLNCEGSGHCLAFSCPLNKTEIGHVAHMLDMWADEPLDEETAKTSGARSAVEYLIKFVEQMNEVLPAELRKKQEPLRTAATVRPKGGKK